MGKKILIGFGIAVLVLLIIAFSVYRYVVGRYNTMVSLDETVKTSWAQVENQFQRRYDLIPNLVETVKGYASHEREVFTQVTEARARVGQAGSVGESIQANQELGSAISRLLLVVENYPQLKANQNFIQLQDELAGTENRIAVERRRYNESARAYNQYIRSFPNKIFAGMFGFTRAELFEAVEGAQEAPKVSF